MGKPLWVVLKVFIGIFLFIGLYIIAALTIQHIPVAAEAGDNADVTIYIKTNGVHTDIVVPVRTSQQDWSQEVKYANTALRDTTYPFLAFGWGDKGFYLQTPTWADLKFSVAFKATTGLSTTAMHTTFYKELHEGATCKKIQISNQQYERLIHYIKESFRTDTAGHFMHIDTKANYGNADAFYEAKGHYCLFYTCNTWANQALKYCGQKCCLWTVLDKGIFAMYDQ